MKLAEKCRTSSCKWVTRAYSLPASFLMLAVTLVGCASGHRSSLSNPDRDVSGYHKIPGTSKSLRTLKKVAAGRTDFKVPIAAAEAERRLLEGANNCYASQRSTSNHALGPAGSLWKSKISRVVVTEQWPEISARVIGLGRYQDGAITDPQGGFGWMYVITAIGEGESLVQAYQRGNSKPHFEPVAAAVHWLAGATSRCEFSDQVTQ